MSFIPSIEPPGAMIDMLRLNPDAARLLVQYHTVVMRGPSPLTPAEREWIAAYVSAQNACHYCHGVHAATARAFGVSPALLAEAANDPDAAAVSGKMRPVLRFVRKLTLDQARMTRADADAVLAAGWSERALHDIICVTALFNFMNRFVHGHGLDLEESVLARRGEGLMRSGYDPLLELLDKPAAE